MEDHLKITFFGDSICTAQYVAIHKGWVTRTSASLAEMTAQEKNRWWLQILRSMAEQPGKP